jgi:enediyne biosynthesis protein E4
MKFKLLTILLILAGAVITGCTRNKNSTKNQIEKNTLFQLVSPDTSGIRFANNITSSDTVNLFSFEYMYNGGGIGIGDFNKDGLSDIFFCGNQVPSRLYINKGNFHFEDITTTAGISISRGCPFGVSVVDINQDGLPDIYVSVGGPGLEDVYPNKLFINQGPDKNGKAHFSEMANEYGLADSGQSIQAVFFDYDHDGDLDMYQLTGGGFDKSPNVPAPIIKDGSAKNTDRLYRNDFNKSLGHPVFTNVSKQAGIVEEGFGLGVSLIDINEDGWQDVYVTNDYISNDLLYINNKNGTFTESAQQYFKHTSHFAMGNDVGDINNDGLQDVVVADMLPDDHYERMLMFGPNQYDKFYYAISQGYSYQYMRNTLQLNRGNGKFSEIGQLAGMYKTSWSWAPVFADLDNDGYQDLFITNGFGKNITDLDFVKYRSDVMKSDDPKKQARVLMDSLSARPGIKTHPYAYKNNGDYTFTNVSRQWGFDVSTYSNGVVYADLDNDGDLDMITNNIDEPAHVYRNTVKEKSTEGASNFLRLLLKGPPNNNAATGSRIDIKYGNQIQTRNLNTIRGFQSSVEPFLHFGLGNRQLVDTVIITWPDNKQSILTNIKANQLLAVDYSTAILKNSKQPLKTTNTVFTEIATSALQIYYKNKHVDFNDFNYERLLPRKYSEGGPGIAVADMNGDGLEDFFVGGVYGQSGEIYLQNKSGTFTGHTLGNAKDYSQDAGCLLFDADADGDADLYVASGGNEFTDKDPRYQDRLYINDGKGNFIIDATALPSMLSSKSCVVAADYDADGDNDLFVGGAVTPGFYPVTPTSYILQNNKGKFTDVTEITAPGLRKIGMVTSALFTDIDNDLKPDLLVVGEWMPVCVFKNTNGKFTNTTVASGLQNTEGWWQSIVSGDFDNDGDMDYIVGNWGLNTPYKASLKKPVSVCFTDFDHNGSIDPIVCYFQEGINYPVAPWDFIVEQIPSLRKKFPTYASYSAASMEKLLFALDTKGMQTLTCKMLHSVYLQNTGNNKFAIKQLPIEAQFAPIFGMLAEDVNLDGNLDLITVGNFYGTEVITGNYDASQGLVMYGDGKGNLKPANITATRFIADKNSKGIVRIQTINKSSLIIVTNNSDSVNVFKYNRKGIYKHLYPTPNEKYATVIFKNNTQQKIELYAGNCHLSQSSKCIVISPQIKHLNLFTGNGIKTRSFNY